MKMFQTPPVGPEHGPLQDSQDGGGRQPGMTRHSGNSLIAHRQKALTSPLSLYLQEAI